VREALRVGWIDGVRKSLGDEACMIVSCRAQRQRVERDQHPPVEQLIAEGCMHAAGLRALKTHAHRSGLQLRIARWQSEALSAPFEALAQQRRGVGLLAGAAAGFKRKVVHWVTSAKHDETKGRRLEGADRRVRRGPPDRGLTAVRVQAEVAHSRLAPA
jgi:hypothetical protein